MMTNFSDLFSSTSPRRRLGAVALAFLVGRVVTGTLIRLPFVFETTIHEGLGISLTTLTAILGIRELTGIASPALGRLSDAGRQNHLIVGGLLLAAATSLAAGFLTNIWLWSGIIIVGGLAAMAFQIAQHSFLGSNVRFDRRGRIVGIVELSWALSYLLGAPAMALLIEWGGWQRPFVVMGIAFGASALLAHVALTVFGASQRIDSATATEAAPTPGLAAPATTAQVSTTPELETSAAASESTRRQRSLGIWLFAVFHPLVQMLIFAIHGDWFARDLSMTTAQIGTATLIVGCGELIGTTLAVWLADTVGKRRLARTGLALAAPLLASLAFVGTNGPMGVALLSAAALCLELAFVSALPIFSEVDPERRGQSVGRLFVIVTVTRAATAPLAGLIYTRGGINTISLFCGATALVAVVAMSTNFLNVGEVPSDPPST